MDALSSPIALTTGEPAGIGPLISLRAALDWQQQPNATPLVLIGDIAHLRAVARQFDLPAQVVAAHLAQPHTPEHIAVAHCPLAAPVALGQLDARNAAYVLQTLDAALHGIDAGTYAAMVTAPVHKGVINDAGVAFSGHTEYLAAYAGVAQVVMLLADGREVAQPLRVALATTHVPLQRVSAALSVDGLLRIIRILVADLQQKFHIASPRILVTGLNPHAGEGGHMGSEEIDVIAPAIEQARAHGWCVSGPYPADTVFQPHYLAQADVVLAMYHDQGLPVLKYATFGQGVNITLGLPFVRTSVDHGTALDLAATGRAEHSSLLAAIRVAASSLRPAH